MKKRKRKKKQNTFEIVIDITKVFKEAMKEEQEERKRSEIMKKERTQLEKLETIKKAIDMVFEEIPIEYYDIKTLKEASACLKDLIKKEKTPRPF